MKVIPSSAPVVAEYLRALPAFRSLTEEDRIQVATEARLRTYDKGDGLFRLDEPARELLCLVRGGVRVYRLLPDGKEKVIHLLQAPALVAEAPTLTGGRYPSAAECTAECLLVAIPREALLRMATELPELPWRMMAELFSRLRELTTSLESHSQQSGVNRVASYLLGLGHGSSAVDLPAAKKDVASYLGLRAESFSRALKALQRTGAIAISERQIRILDRAALEEALAD